MTPREQQVSWRSPAFAVVKGAPWRLVVRIKDREVTLADHEVIALCAAVEIGTVHAGNVAALLTRRARRQKPWTFEDLRGASIGIALDDVLGALPIGEALRLAGLEVVRSEVRVKENA